jgi:hypothetical protein
MACTYLKILRKKFAILEKTTRKQNKTKQNKSIILCYNLLFSYDHSKYKVGIFAGCIYVQSIFIHKKDVSNSVIY